MILSRLTVKEDLLVSEKNLDDKDGFSQFSSVSLYNNFRVSREEDVEIYLH